MLTIDRTRELAEDRGVSLSFLCRKMGVAKAYFLDREKAEKEIPDEKLQIISECLYTTIDYLKGKTDQKEKPATPEGDELSDEDIEIIELLRAASPAKRAALLALLKE